MRGVVAGLCDPGRVNPELSGESEKKRDGPKVVNMYVLGV